MEAQTELRAAQDTVNETQAMIQNKASTRRFQNLLLINLELTAAVPG
jgi:hypothetical protein